MNSSLKDGKNKEKETTEKKEFSSLRFVMGAVGIFLCIVLAAGAVLAAGSIGEAYAVKKAEKVLLENDYEKALECLEGIKTTSKYYSDAQTRIKEIKAAVECQKQAEKYILRPSFIAALDACEEAKKYNTGMPMIDETYEKAQSGLAKYVIKLMDEERYVEAAEVIERIDPDHRSADIENAEKTIDSQVQAYFTDAKKYLKDGDLNAAAASLSAAEAIAPDYPGAANLRETINAAYKTKINSDIDKGMYDSAFSYLNDAKEFDVTNVDTDQTKVKIAASYVQEGRNMFARCDMVSAGKTARKALEYDPNSQDARALLTDISTYNRYIEYLAQGVQKHNDPRSGTQGWEYLAKVPADDEIGALARSQYKFFVDAYNNNEEAPKEKPKQEEPQTEADNNAAESEE